MQNNCSILRKLVQGRHIAMKKKEGKHEESKQT
jgi:hypothetical protein